MVGKADDGKDDGGDDDMYGEAVDEVGKAHKQRQPGGRPVVSRLPPLANITNLPPANNNNKSH